MVHPSASGRGVDSQNAIPLLASTARLLLSVRLLDTGRTEEAFRTGTGIGIQATGVTLDAEAHPEEGALQGTTGGEGALLGVQMRTADVSEIEAGAKVQGIEAQAGVLERGSQLAKTLNLVWGHHTGLPSSLLQNHSALVPQSLHPDREVWLAMQIDHSSRRDFLVICLF
jgi:hypothetical protein